MSTLDAIEKDLDDVEARLDVLDPLVETLSIVRNNRVRIAGAVILAASAGAALGYYVAKKRLEAKYDEIIEVELAEAKEYYSAQYKQDEYETVEKAVQKLIPAEERTPQEKSEKVSKKEKAAKKALTNYQGLSQASETPVSEIELTPVEAGEEVVRSNIFVNGEPLNEEDYDSENEEALKSMGRPYVISEEDFVANESSYDEQQVTWYAKDEVLADDRDQEIEDSDDLVGDINMTKFGQWSNDKHIVFIQNDEKEIIFEVARSKGSYAEEVRGLKHSDDREPVRRFRGDDD